MNFQFEIYNSKYQDYKMVNLTIKDCRQINSSAYGPDLTKLIIKFYEEKVDLDRNLLYCIDNI